MILAVDPSEPTPLTHFIYGETWAFQTLGSAQGPTANRWGDMWSNWDLNCAPQVKETICALSMKLSDSGGDTKTLCYLLHLFWVLVGELLLESTSKAILGPAPSQGPVFVSSQLSRDFSH